MVDNALFDRHALQAGLLEISDDGNEYSLRCESLLQPPRGSMSYSLWLPPVYDEPPPDAVGPWPTPYLKPIGVDFVDRIDGRSASLIDPVTIHSVRVDLLHGTGHTSEVTDSVILTVQRLEPMQLHFDDVRRERVNTIGRSLLNKELAEVYKLKALCGGHPMLFTLRLTEVDEAAEAAAAAAVPGQKRSRELTALASHNAPGKRRAEATKWGVAPVQPGEESKLGDGFQNQSLAAHQQDALRARRRAHVDQANNAAFAPARGEAIVLETQQALELYEFVYLTGVAPA